MAANELNQNSTTRGRFQKARASAPHQQRRGRLRLDDGDQNYQTIEHRIMATEPNANWRRHLTQITSSVMSVASSGVVFQSLSIRPNRQTAHNWSWPPVYSSKYKFTPWTAWTCAGCRWRHRSVPFQVLPLPPSGPLDNLEQLGKLCRHIVHSFENKWKNLLLFLRRKPLNLFQIGTLLRLFCARNSLSGSRVLKTIIVCSYYLFLWRSYITLNNINIVLLWGHLRAMILATWY